MVFFISCAMEKNIKYLGLELSSKRSKQVIQLIKFIYKEASGELMKDLMKVMKRAKLSYVPVEKLIVLLQTIIKVQ
jgi:23S rRNA (guanosine2251-2'-O)-methyltransferase